MHENIFSLSSRQITICVKNESTHARFKCAVDTNQLSGLVCKSFCCVLGPVEHLRHFGTGGIDLTLHTWNQKPL